jgi:O-antigen/teichoic acid export membrane protein
MHEKVVSGVVAILRYTQRFTKTDMVYLAQGGFWLTLGQAWAALGAFLFSLVAARYLSPDAFGTYRYLLSLIAIIGACSLTGIGTSIVQAIARGFHGTLRSGFRQSFLWSTPAALAILGASGYYALQGNMAFALALAAAALAMPFTNAAQLYTAYLNGTKDFARHSIYWMVGNMLSVGTMITAAIYTQHVAILVGAYVGSQMAANLILYARTRQLVQNEDDDPSVPRYAIHLSVINLLNTITSQIDRILVFQLLGPAQLAIYTFANAIPEQARALVKAGARLSLPKFAEKSLADIQSTISHKIVVFGLVVLVGCIAYVIAAPYLYTFLFPAYMASVPYSQVIAFSLVFALGTVLLSALQAHTKVPELYAHATVTSVAQIVSSASFIWLWGLWGAVAALFVNRVLSLALPFVLVRLARDSKPPQTND